MLAITDAGIESGIDNIDEGAVSDDIQLDLRELLQEWRNHRRQYQVDRRRRRVDAQPAGRYAAQAAHPVERLRDIRHRGTGAGEQQLPGFRQSYTAGGTVHQT